MQFIPGAYIQFLRLDGYELTDAIKEQKEIDGSLPDMLRLLDEIFLAHISVSSNFTSGLVEARRPEYPIVALQQIARNAVLHRTYENTNAPVRITWFTDRVEIQSPGGPYGQVNISNFGQPGITDYRNPHLATVMKDLGYIQRFGFGIPYARQEMPQKTVAPRMGRAAIDLHDSFQNPPALSLLLEAGVLRQIRLIQRASLLSPGDECG